MQVFLSRESRRMVISIISPNVRLTMRQFHMFCVSQGWDCLGTENIIKGHISCLSCPLDPLPTLFPVSGEHRYSGVRSRTHFSEQTDIILNISTPLTYLNHAPSCSFEQKGRYAYERMTGSSYESEKAQLGWFTEVSVSWDTGMTHCPMCKMSSGLGICCWGDIKAL